VNRGFTPRLLQVGGVKSSPLLRKLANALGAPDAPGAFEHLLVAVSGGPDSTALLAALAEAAPPRGWRLTAVHLDHGLRGDEGAREGERVAALADRLDVPCVRRTIAVSAGANLEARARAARYRALGEIAAEIGATRIVTGHTQDDQVETLLLRLLRGAGRRGLGGMRPVRGRLYRPFLEVTRADVRRFLAERDLAYAVDRSNAHLRHARNRVRRLLVPFLEAEFNPRLAPAVAALASRLRDEDDLLAALASGRTRALVTGDALAVAVAQEPRALARRIVRAWLERGAERGVSATHVERVLALAAQGAHGTVSVPGPARVVREGGALVRRAGREPARGQEWRYAIAPGQEVAHVPGGWRLRLSLPRPRRPDEERAPSPAQALFDAERLPADLCVRSPQAGDRIRLLAGGTRKLQDVLVDAKVPREARVHVPLFLAGGSILWVAGLARGRGADLVAATRRVVEATLVRTS
jgi:tRNA(Ile)-lysidine synthase